METFISDTIVSERTGEPLEHELRARGILKEQQEKLSNAIHQLEKTQASRVAFERMEDEWMKYDSLYGEEAYRLGVRDGIEIGKEQKVGREKTIISFKDMTNLVRIYDAVKVLNITLLGEWIFHTGDEGVLGAMERIYSVIEHGICEEIRLLGDDEVADCLTGILDDESSTEEEKAKKLLGMD